MLRTTMAALQGTCHTATPSEKWGNCQRQYTASYVVTSHFKLLQLLKYNLIELMKRKLSLKTAM